RLRQRRLLPLPRRHRGRGRRRRRGHRPARRGDGRRAEHRQGGRAGRGHGLHRGKALPALTVNLYGESVTTTEPLRATFTSMTEGTAEDWQRIAASQLEFYPGLPDRVMDHLRLLGGDHGGFIVDRLTHSLQTAT